MINRFILRFCLSVIIIGMIFTAHAESVMSAGKLKSLCDNDTGKLICIGYISGVTDALVLMSDLKKSNTGTSIICAPSSGISNDLAMRVVLTYITVNPEASQQSARVVIFAALMKSYPC